MEMMTTIDNIIDDTSIDNLLETTGNILEAIKRMNDRTKKLGGTIKEVQETTYEHDKSIGDIKKKLSTINTIASPTHHSRKLTLQRICKRRVHHLLGASTGFTYNVFSPFFFKQIYADMAKELELDHWSDICMDNYEDTNSPYNQAKEYGESWKPSGAYVRAKLEDLQERRDNGYLEQARCRALTDYLAATQNGRINPFA